MAIVFLLAGLIVFAAIGVPLAFAIGALLLGAVLVIPVLQPLMQVAVLPNYLLGAVVGLPFASLLLIQLLKVILNRK